MSNGDICLKSANRLTDSIMHQNMAAINGSSLLLYRTFHRSFTLAAESFIVVVPGRCSGSQKRIPLRLSVIAIFYQRAWYEAILWHL